MFGLGSIGNFLPLIGSIGSGFSGGGLFGLGFTLLSGLLTNITSPSNPGINNFGVHPGFSTAQTNPGFGTMGGGPNASTFGSMAGYFGSNYTSDYSILPQTQSGQYHNNSSYSYGNQGVSYSPNSPVTYANGYQQNYGQRIGQLQFGGHLPGYLNQYNSVVLPQAPFFPSYQYGQSAATYGSAPAPYQQSCQPAVSHYGFGNSGQYNPASTLYGQQNGSVQVCYGRPTYGGPQGDKTVVNNHYNINLHNHNHNQVSVDCEPPKQVDCEDTKPKPHKGKPSTPAPQPEQCETPPAVKPPVSHYPKPTPAPVDDCATDTTTPAVKDNGKVNLPAAIVSTNSQAVQNLQTKWGKTPHITNNSEWAYASQSVRDRITGGDSSSYTFGGRNIFENSDGKMPERAAVWHVFQQNESLRLDMKSGYFYETKPDGSTHNKFHLSAVADLERQAGNDHVLGSRLIGDFLNARNLNARGLDSTGGTSSQTNTAATVPVAATVVNTMGNAIAAASPQQTQQTPASTMASFGPVNVGPQQGRRPWG